MGCFVMRLIEFMKKHRVPMKLQSKWLNRQARVKTWDLDLHQEVCNPSSQEENKTRKNSSNRMRWRCNRYLNPVEDKEQLIWFYDKIKREL